MYGLSPAENLWNTILWIICEHIFTSSTSFAACATDREFPLGFQHHTSVHMTCCLWLGPVASHDVLERKIWIGYLVIEHGKSRHCQHVTLLHSTIFISLSIFVITFISWLYSIIFIISFTFYIHGNLIVLFSMHH